MSRTRSHSVSSGLLALRELRCCVEACGRHHLCLPHLQVFRAACSVTWPNFIIYGLSQQLVDVPTQVSRTEMCWLECEVQQGGQILPGDHRAANVESRAATWTSRIGMWAFSKKRFCNECRWHAFPYLLVADSKLNAVVLEGSARFADVFCAFSLPNVLLATAACKFFDIATWKSSTRRYRQFFSIFTSKFAFRHSGVQFLMSPLSTYLRARRFNRPTSRLTRRTNHWKNLADFHAGASSYFRLDCLSHLLFNSPYCRKFAI